MGLFGAMTASVSGLGAQGQAISVISDNLANTNTIGYKASRTLFNQLVTSAGVSGTAYNSGGVGTDVGTDQASQGSFITSTSKTDIAISGNGFFRVADAKSNSSATGFYYTRAGSFAEDKEGYLVNPGGYYLQGWATDSNGAIVNVQDPQAISLQSVGVSAKATSEYSIDANLTNTETINTVYGAGASLETALNAVLADPTKADYVTDIRVYDAQGGARDMTIAFTKRSANTWDWQIVTDGKNIQGGTEGVDMRVGQGMLEFNTNGGSLKYATALNIDGTPRGNMTVDIPWANGVDASAITFNFGDFTGGKTVTAHTGGLNQATTTPVPAATGFSSPATGAAVTGTPATGTYTLQKASATTMRLVDGAGVVFGTATLATADGAGETFTFTNGGNTISATMAGTYSHAAAGAIPAAQGTVTVAATTSGGVLNIALENPLINDLESNELEYMGNGVYRLTTNLSAQAPAPNYEEITVTGSGNRELYFAGSGVRITVGENFNPPIGVVGDFSVTPMAALDKGIGTDGITQLSSAYNTTAVNQNGFGAGTLSGISIDAQGFVNGTFTNGETKKLYKVALAVFQNPRGLEMISGSLLRTTEASGQALLKEPGVGGTGSLVGGSLEGSTTDIAGEFSNMIVAQRAFQASSKVITTVDQMLNELLQLR